MTSSLLQPLFGGKEKVAEKGQSLSDLEAKLETGIPRLKSTSSRGLISISSNFFDRFCQCTNPKILTKSNLSSQT